MARMIQFACCVSAMLLTLLLIGGCSQKITAATVRRNLTPELETLSLTHEQRLNVHARTKNLGWRQLESDLDRLLLLDRPVRLTRYPVP